MNRLEQVPPQVDVLVIGAGPAGMAAATTLAAAGLTTVVADEGAGPGGQVWRAVTSTPVGNRPVLGADYWTGFDAAQAFLASGATYLPQTTVWSLDETATANLSSGGVSRAVAARHVVIATGAMERPFPVPGWTLPGVMTVGGAQTVLKASGLLPQGRMVIAGTGPLIWLYAAQVLRAGGHIDRILDTTDVSARKDALAHAPAFMASSLLAKGLALVARVRRTVPVVSGIESLAIEGDGKAETLRYSRGGRDEHCAADTVLLHQGVVPQCNLAMAAGVPHVWDDAGLAFVPEVDGMGRTPCERIWIAGDGAGIAGWEAAVDRGELAAIGVLESLRPGASDVFAIRRLQKSIARRQRVRRFVDRLSRPAEAFRIPTGDTVVCRCEEVTAREVEAAADLGCLGPAQLKSYTRCGMGPCQGRLCGLSVTEILATRRGVLPGDVGYFRLRPPVKPVTLAELASAPTDDIDQAAVAGRRR
ncbi:MAG: NAD(P)/FAD-dependent oxidoreductase [Hyphomicrobiaceae bacterium]